MTIANITNASVVSFNEVKPSLTKANNLILLLLTDACEKNKSISRDDILELWWYWRYGKDESVKMGKRESSYSRVFDKWTYTWVEVVYTKKEYLSRTDVKGKAIIWFKQNLGAVILKGRLLVLPVIDVQ